MTLYLDCEWTIDQEIFLIGFAFADGRSGSLQGHQLHRQTVSVLPTYPSYQLHLCRIRPTNCIYAKTSPTFV
jgi:hypothetical protein